MVNQVYKKMIFEQFSKGPKRETSKQERKDLEKYNPVDDKAGMSRYKKKY